MCLCVYFIVSFGSGIVQVLEVIMMDLDISILNVHFPDLGTCR